MVKNPQYEGQVKHINIKFPSIIEQTAMETIEQLFCQNKEMIDVLTKGLTGTQFVKL